MGWQAGALPVVGDDAGLWSAADAAALLGPPQLSAAQVRQLIHLCSIEAAGRRRPGPRSRGRYARVYPAAKLIAAYDAVYTAASR